MELIIKTSDSFGEKSSERVACTKEIKSKGRMYSYTTELGDSKIFVLEDRVQIMRSGEVKSNQTIKLDEETRFNYTTPYMKRNFTLKTLKLVIEERKISATYVIYDGQEEVNRLDVEIVEVVN